MSHRTQSFAGPSVAIAGLVTLLGASDAMAQERITLETIGAVRMARVEEIRNANPGFRPADHATPSHEQAVERAAKAR